MRSRLARGSAIVAALLSIGSLRLAAQFPVDVRVNLEKDSVRIGDPFRVFINVSAPRGATIEFPEALDSTSTVQSIDPRAIFAQPDSVGFSQNAVYRVAAWDVGRQPLQLGDVVVRLGGESRSIPIVGRSVFVVSVLPADSASRVPKPARALFLDPFIPWWFWALLATIAALLLGFWWWWRRRKRAVAAEVIVDPYVRARRDFERIERLGLVEAGERSRYVALVVDVLREYVADRVPGAPLSLTSTELLAVTQHARTLPHDRLLRILNEADLVKFARRPVSVERARDIGREAQALVEHEHQASQPTPSDAAATPPQGRAA
ncbi:MAG TPA: hypothetical protein VFO55_13160 [Gemmatimonadaceae bacterium]|nr:hypothetical protein [Gemmatimonadaceae bacterium]